jgi:glycosyltransferase involved in cell wall biosynthesis
MAATKDIIAQKETWLALLGRRDTPVDGVEDYCAFLGRALGAREIELQRARVPWMENGWIGALRWLAHESGAWRGKWVIVQYTALSWSRHGFPVLALAVLAILRRGGARVAVVFHEPMRQGGSRLLDRFRGACQDWVIRKLYRRAEKPIFTVPLKMVSWLPEGEEKAAFIPIGANIPERLATAGNPCESDGAVRTVAVFCLSPGRNRFLEVADMVHAARYVHNAGVPTRLVVLGRGSDEAGVDIERALEGSGVEVVILGRLPAEEVSQVLSRASVLLFVYGVVSLTRGSALAGLACGLPVIGYAGGVEGSPFEEAGVELVPYRNQDALAEALARVLMDAKHRATLCDRSRRAQEKYFSWPAIADRYVAAMSPRTESGSSRNPGSDQP